MFTVRSMSKRKYFFFLSLMILILILSPSSLNFSRAIVRYNFTIPLVLKTNGGGVKPDICLYTAQYLRDIGIEVEVRVEEWTVFLGTIHTTQDFDLAFVTLEGGTGSPDLRNVYAEDGSQNIFGLTQDMPYGDQSEEMQNQGVTTVDLDARQQLYYEWQQLMMDKLVPMLPFYSARNYIATWANTEGYNIRWGISDSLPYMNYNGYHAGQVDLTEFNIADANWNDLNPLMSEDSSSSFIQSLIMEPIVQMNPDFAPLKTGLVYDWDQIDENHYQFWMLDDIFWNPSYNSIDRDSNSVPLPSIPTGELMVGLKTGEYSDGNNQQVTAKDAVFTYIAWANSVVSESTIHCEWISDIYVDPVDNLSFHIHVDSDPETPEIEGYADMWARLPRYCLPEFFLNSTNPTVTYTEGGVETTGLYPGITDTPQWVAYLASAFGCGKYSLDYAVRNSVTVLKRSPYWFGKGAITGETGLTPFVETIKVRVIPDISAALAQFKAGKLDIVDVSNLPSDRKIMQANPQYDVQSYLGNSLSCLAFNLRRPLIGGSSNEIFLLDEGKEMYTKATALRKAICYAIDRNEINDVLFDGESLICHSPLNPSLSFYYYNDIIKYDYNLEKAKEWFDATSSVPVMDLTVENHHKVGKNINFIADYTSGPNVTNSILTYSVNYSLPFIAPMIKEKDSYYTSDIGSDYVENITIEFTITATNVFGNDFAAGVFSFRVGVKYNEFLASYPIISLLVILVIPVIFRVKRRKKIS